MSSGEKSRKAEILLNVYTLSPAHTNTQAQTQVPDTDTAAVKAITMIQTCPWEMV